MRKYKYIALTANTSMGRRGAGNTANTLRASARSLNAGMRWTIRDIANNPKATMEKEEKEIIGKAKEYAVAQFQARSDVKHTEQAMLSICWYNGHDLAAAFKEGAEWKLKKIANRMYNIGYSYDSIAEALGIDCADVVDMLDLDE